MSATSMNEFIDWCISLEIRFTLDGENLRVAAPPENLKGEVVAKIRERKPEIIAWLQQQQQRASQTSRAKVVRVPRQPNRFPLSYTQQRVWFIDQMEGGSAHYNMVGALQVDGAIDMALAEQAMQQIIARHEILHTVFLEDEQGPYQTIRPDFQCKIVQQDLTALSAPEQEAVFQASLQAEAARSFHLASEVMLRVQYLHTSPSTGWLIINMPHIASDAWSGDILNREFATMYMALAKGQAAQLPDLPLQYVDFAVWQRGPEHSAEIQEQMRFWREALASCPKIHSLPLDKPRPAQQSFRARRHQCRIAPEQLQGLQQLAKQQGSTLFMLLQAAFAGLLSRWSGDTDIMLAVPSAGRSSKEVEPVIGFFSNTLVFRSDLSGNSGGNPSFRQLLQASKEYALNAFANQDVPFELLVEELRPERELSFNPLCQIKFLLHSDAPQDLSLPEMAMRPVNQVEQSVRFDLDLTLVESAQGLSFNWTYKEDLFLPESIVRMANAYIHLLQQIVANPDLELSQYALLDQAGLQQYLQQASGPAVAAGRETLLHTLFEQTAQAQPNQIALAYQAAGAVPEQRLTYQQLNQKANRLAHYLIEQGVEAGQQVGVYVERSVQLMVALLAVLKTGATYVPFEPKNTSQRLGHIIRDAKIEWVLVQDGLVDQLPIAGIDVMVLDEAEGDAWLAEYPAHNPVDDGVQVSGDAIAYLMYTSGSTGVPKGVEIYQRGLIDYCAFGLRNYYQAQLNGSLIVTSHGFDITVPSLYLPLLRGDTVRFLQLGDELLDLAARLQEPKTPNYLLRMTPMHVRGLLDLLPSGQVMHGQHVFVIGGEAFTLSLARELQQRFASSQVFNHYGPTEAVVGCAMFDVTANMANLSRVLPIGYPMENTRLYVLNQSLQACPTGVVGQLYIGGEGVAKGYLHQPELTAEKFIADSLCTELFPGEASSGRAPRLYKTGDLARYLPNGAIEFLGRMDDQVKLRGYRIELGEVRNLLLRQPQVKEALVTVQGEGEQKRLVAFIIPSQPQADDSMLEQLRADMKKAVPEYMLPSAMALLAQFPLSANGKIDVKALPVLDSSNLNRSQFVAASNPVEQALCEIWQGLLKREQVGIHDNFFAIGGDSILSIQVVARANKAGIGISTRQLFAHQTVAELAQHAKLSQHLDQELAQRQQANQLEVQGEMRLLPVQRQFLLQAGNHPQHYNQALLLQTPANFSSQQLQQVMTALIARHDALRLRLQHSADGQWQPLHHAFTSQDLQDCVREEKLPANLTPVALAAHLQARCDAYQRLSDPVRGPMLRAVVFQPAEGAPANTGRLFLVAHHMVVDGVSWRIILADLERAYRQLQAGQAIELEAKTSSFQAWGEAVTAYAQRPELAQETAYWLAQLNEPVAALPSQAAEKKLSRSDLTVASTRSVSLQWTPAETELLLAQAGQRYRTQINELLLSALYLGMRAWRAGQDGLRIVLEGHGREDLFDSLDVSQTLGWFTTTYPLRLYADASEIGGLIKQIKEQHRSLPKRGFGYGVLRHIAGVPELAAAEQAHTPQLIFNYLGQFDQDIGSQSAFQAASEASGSPAHAARMRPYALGLNGNVAGGILRFNLDYSELEFSREQMTQLGQHIEAALRQVIAHCTTPAATDTLPFNLTLTPSDFPLAKVSMAELDSWQQQYQISKLYPATPMQQGMLFHTMLDRGAYITQTYPVLRGALDAEKFRAAWDFVTTRYDIFRTVFVGQGDHLHQLVVKQAQMPWLEQDWRHLSAEQQASQFAELCEQDRAAGCDISQAPLQRITLIRLSEQRYHLLWTHHHMLLDGWCTPVVYRDVMIAYQCLQEGTPLPSKPVPAYESYIAWMQQQDQEQARQFWREYLGVLHTPTRLQIERLDAPAQDPRGELSFTLNPEQTVQLLEFAKTHRTTLNTLCQLAWAYLLHRYTGEQHVVFGSTISGRPAEVVGVEEMVGLFINTVPVRVSFTDLAQQNMAQMLAQVQNDFQQCTAYGYMSLSEIQQCSGLQGMGPLFDSLLVFENYPLDASMDSAIKPGLEIESLDSFIDNSYHLTLNVHHTDALRVRANFDAFALRPAAMQALMAQLQYLLVQMLQPAADGKALHSMADWQVLSQAERQQLLYDWNQTAWPHTAPQCLHQMIEAQAALHPDACAVSLGAASMSYRQLNQRANRLAHFLLEQGVERGQQVGVYVERSIELMVALLGIMKTGAAYVPFDPKNTRQRLGHIISDAKIEWVVLQGSLMGNLPVAGIDMITLDEDASEDWMADYPDHNPTQDEAQVALDDTVYVMYTSGSTGVPKGVAISHIGLMDYCSFASRSYYQGSAQAKLKRDGSLVVTAHCFDITVPSLYVPLIMGDSVRFLQAGEELSDLAAQLHASGCPNYLLRMTPMHVRALLDTMDSRSPEAQAAGAERQAQHVFVIGGEAFTATLAKQLQQHFPRSQVYNHYGPTETVVGCAMFDVTAHGDLLEQVLPIGRPMDNTRLYVLHADLTPCPVGAVGQLHIGGLGVAKGYLNQPQLSAEKFIADPFVAGERLYRSGDTARFLASGDIEYLGRMDDQVKLRGYRIELGEIRAQLMLHEQVKEALVLVKGEGEDKRLIAYLVPHTFDADKESTLIDAVRAHLRAVLPDYMQPAAYSVLAAFPLTANGKIDQRSLLASGDVYLPQQSMVAPANPTEEKLVSLWQKILGLESVSCTANFFEIGGHSLLAMRLINAVQTEFEIAFSLKALMEHQTIQLMASKILATLALQSNTAGAENDDNSIEMEW